MFLGFYRGYDQRRPLAEAQKIYKNQNEEQLFKQIEPDKAIYSDSAKPFGSYTSSKFGYSIDLQNTAWVAWTDIHSNYPEAEIGGLAKDNAAFAMKN